MAVRVAYDGAPFAGSQRQPDQRTVEGELLRGLAKLGAVSDPAAARFQCASRTDKGVSAAGNVVAFDTAFRLDALLPALGAATEDVWPLALAEVPAGFDARRDARSRTYTYFLGAAGLRRAPLEEALARFVGTHDFRAFARLEPGVDPVRTVSRIAVRDAGGAWEVEVAGASFLWNQVRRMVAAARAVAAGEASLGDIERGLRGERVDLGLLAAEGLVLRDVDHGLAWVAHPTSTLAAQRTLDAMARDLALRARVVGALREGVRAAGRQRAELDAGQA